MNPTLLARTAAWQLRVATFAQHSHQTPPMQTCSRRSQIQPNTLSFRSVPLNPPGPRGVRTLRITNLRVNAAALAAQTPAPKTVQMGVQIFSFSNRQCCFDDRSRTEFSRAEGRRIVCAEIGADTPPALKGTPAITIPPATLPVGAPQSLIGFNLKFTENFLRRVSGARNVGTSSDNPLFMTVQAVPGLLYITESGFLNTLFPNDLKMDAAGLADSGTRLIARFQNVPKDVLIWVTTRDTKAGTTQYSETTARAILTTADANGLGPLTPVKPSINGLSQIPVVNGTATAVWEVVSASPAVLQDISFGVAISAQTANPGQGTVMVTAGMGPWAAPRHERRYTAVQAPGFLNSCVCRFQFNHCTGAELYVGGELHQSRSCTRFDRFVLWSAVGCSRRCPRMALVRRPCRVPASS